MRKRNETPEKGEGEHPIHIHEKYPSKEKKKPTKHQSTLHPCIINEKEGEINKKGK